MTTPAAARERLFVALDLPGHGHSSHRSDHVYWPADNAAAGLPTPDKIVNYVVSSVAVRAGAIDITFGHPPEE